MSITHLRFQLPATTDGISTCLPVMIIEQRILTEWLCVLAQARLFQDNCDQGNRSRGRHDQAIGLMVFYRNPQGDVRIGSIITVAWQVVLVGFVKKHQHHYVNDEWWRSGRLSVHYFVELCRPSRAVISRFSVLQHFGTLREKFLVFQSAGDEEDHHLTFKC